MEQRRSHIYTPLSSWKRQYPKAIFYIINHEFWIKFSYFGMITILELYIKNKLDFSDDTSTIIFHAFMFLVYTCPLVGGILADSLLGKFKIIVYSSIVYFLGQMLLSASSVKTFGLPLREFSMIGLLLTAIGIGGLESCVAALGGDQYSLPEQEKYLAKFFSIYYLAICIAVAISTFLTPELRSGIKCFGEQDCYSISFFIPAVLMCLGTVIFVIGKSSYRIEKPEGNIVLDVIKCISHAITRKLKSKRNLTRKNWLDYADDKYDSTLITDIKGALQVLKLLIPMTLFWALYDQTTSRWILQAVRMNGEIRNYLLKPDQMPAITAILVIILIPVFETCVYPLMSKINCLDTQLKKLTTGGFLTSVAFVLSGLVELKLETTHPILPTNGIAQLRIFNPRDCYLPIIMNNQSFVIEPFGMFEDTSINIMGNNTSIPYTADFSQCGGENGSQGLMIPVEGQATSYVLEPSTSYFYKDYINKTKSGNPAIRILTYSTNPKTEVELSGTDFVFETSRKGSNIAGISSVGEFSPGTYQVLVNGEIIDSIVMKLGGVYTLQAFVTANSTKIDLRTVTPPNSVHIFWLLPQYVVITVAEVLFAITGAEFAFTEAPVSMKSILQAGWMLTRAFGNLLVVVITKVKIFERQALEFFLFAGLMAVDMLIFTIMAVFYKYRSSNDDKRNDLDRSPTEIDDPVKNFNQKVESAKQRELEFKGDDEASVPLT